MATARKRISELTALTSASLDTVIVGVDNGTTYKIELDVLADAVTSRVNILDRDRLSSLESVTSSFETKGRSLISSSAQITALGFTSSSANLTSLNSFTSSQSAINTALTNGINARLTTSSFESFSSSVHSEILAATNEQDLTPYVTNLVYGVLSQSVDSRIDNLELNSGSYLTSLSGAISSSSQLTSSYDERYVLSGSITQTTWDNISGKPSGLVSQSTDLTSLNSKTGSYATTGSNTFIGNQRITGSVSILIPGGTAYALNENPSSNNEFWAYVVDYPNAQNVAVGWTAAIVGGGTYTVTAVNYQHPFNKITLSDGSLTMGYRIGINFSKSSKLWEFNSNGTLTGLPDGLISGSSQLTSSFDGRYLVTGSIASSINQLNTFTASVSTASLVNRLNAIESVSGSWITENETGSFLTSLSGAISSSNQLTASFDTRYTLSGSVQPLPNNLISSSAQITSLGFISSSDSTTELNSYTSSLKNAIELTGSTVSFLGNIVVYGTQSVISSTNVELSDNILYLSPTASTDNDLGIVGHYNDGTYRHAGIFMDASDGHSWKVFNGLQTETTATVDTSGTGFTLADFKAGVVTGTSFNGVINATNGVISGSSQLTSSFDTRYAISASYLTSLNGAISSSSQLTGSFDTRYALSGSGGSLPSGLISGSSQLTSSFATTGSNSFSGSQTITGSLIVSSVAVVNGGITIPTGSTISLTSGSNLFVDASGGITGSLSGSVFGIGDVVAFSSSVNNRIISGSAPVGTVSGSSQLTASLDTRYLTIDGDGVISGSTQLTSSFEVRGSGIYSSSAQLPSGLVSGSSQLTSSLDTIYLTIGGDNVISGSSQLTASLDTRYAASGSGGSLPSGVISGSSQLTSSFDGRYLVTGSVTSSILQLNAFTASNANTSLNLFTSSLNVWSSSLATTGSNTFNGNQTITGSLNLTNGNIVASQITANTSSLYLTSGSNMYVQNNGVVEITGSVVVSGSVNIITTSPLQIGTGSGDEGGEILLAKSATNSTLTGSGITIDSYRDRLRIFEQGGDARGVYIDLAKTPTGVSGELIWKSSGMVNAGTFVTLDNIKVTITSSGSRGLSVATVSGTVSGYISGHYELISGSPYGMSSTTSLSTTATSSLFGWNFVNEGDMATYILRDNTNNRVYRIIMIIGGAYNNNFISIERLY